MSDLEHKEALALNYFTIVEKYRLDAENGLHSDLWIQYQTLNNELTGNIIPVRKCRNRTLKAHAYLSDYFKQNNII